MLLFPRLKTKQNNGKNLSLFIDIYNFRIKGSDRYSWPCVVWSPPFSLTSSHPCLHSRCLRHMFFSHFLRPAKLVSVLGSLHCCFPCWECSSALILEWVHPLFLVWIPLKKFFLNEALIDHPILCWYLVILITLGNIFSITLIIILFLLVCLLLVFWE